MLTLSHSGDDLAKTLAGALTITRTPKEHFSDKGVIINEIYDGAECDDCLDQCPGFSPHAWSNQSCADQIEIQRNRTMASRNFSQMSNASPPVRFSGQSFPPGTGYRIQELMVINPGPGSSASRSSTHSKRTSTTSSVPSATHGSDRQSTAHRTGSSSSRSSNPGNTQSKSRVSSVHQSMGSVQKQPSSGSTSMHAGGHGQLKVPSVRQDMVSSQKQPVLYQQNIFIMVQRKPEN